MSLAGRIGRKDGEIVFSNRLDNYRVTQLRESVDALMVDIETILSEDPSLDVKDKSKCRTRIVVDKNAEIPENAKVLSDVEAEVIIGTCKGVSQRKRDTLMALQENLKVVSVGSHAVNLEELLWTLYEDGIRQILLEGSRKLTRRMLDEGLVDEIFLTIVPTVIGEGINFVEGDIGENIELRLEGILQYGDQVVLHYVVK